MELSNDFSSDDYCIDVSINIRELLEDMCEHESFKDMFMYLAKRIASMPGWVNITREEREIVVKALVAMCNGVGYESERRIVEMVSPPPPIHEIRIVGDDQAHVTKYLAKHGYPFNEHTTSDDLKNDPHCDELHSGVWAFRIPRYDDE